MNLKYGVVHKQELTKTLQRFIDNNKQNELNYTKNKLLQSQIQIQLKNCEQLEKQGQYGESNKQLQKLRSQVQSHRLKKQIQEKLNKNLMETQYDYKEIDIQAGEYQNPPILKLKFNQSMNYIQILQLLKEYNQIKDQEFYQEELLLREEVNLQLQDELFSLNETIKVESENSSEKGSNYSNSIDSDKYKNLEFDDIMACMREYLGKLFIKMGEFKSAITN
ncbi:hypothetical protein PPERSA_05490 [Pseudocohnilembus persalinus]|uniref:Uncharacterized protein n=1 Tax=Pseudocohnilembus persalinus TaxID=266149 RepID=A0A0V0QCN0_PSEPJ|nr:hypothetical protein PPERSA_05490 [Pseudocohnilembus persalinus]|eukprot:KRW99987.1 hypothetical protein PPERSA_05490 [Pseudocohnilembus persalinus]